MHVRIIFDCQIYFLILKYLKENEIFLVVKQILA